MNTLLINRSTIKELISMKEVVDAVEKTFNDFGEGKVHNPTKAHLDLGDVSGWPSYKAGMNAMPAYVGWLDSAGLKWIGGWMRNYEKGLPYLSSISLLVNPSNGEFKAAMDGTYLTDLRTGAQSAVAAKYLVPKKEITMGLYGAGAQGHTQVKAFKEVFDIKSLKVYDIHKTASEKLAKDFEGKIPGDIVICDSPHGPSDADVIATVTHASTPFLKAEWIKPGTVVFAMGSFQECEDELILGVDKIVVDHIDQTLHRGAMKKLNAAGRITENNIYATIGEVVAGKKQPRDNENEKIFCVPIGTGAMDVAVATLVYEKAKDLPEKAFFDFTS
jgi:ornithine cyclodeaminase/alanine dehydrogenase